MFLLIVIGSFGPRVVLQIPQPELGGDGVEASNRLLGYKALGRLTLPQFQENLVSSQAQNFNHDGTTLQTGLELSCQNHPPTDEEINSFVDFLCRPFCDKQFRSTISDSIFDNHYICLMFPMVEFLVRRYEKGENDPQDTFSSNLLKSSGLSSPPGALRFILESNPGMLLTDNAYKSLILTAAARQDLEDLEFVHKIIKALDNYKNLECVSLPDTVFSDALEFATGATDYADIAQVISDIKAGFSK